MVIWVRRDIFISDIPSQDGGNIQEKDGKEEIKVNQKTGIKSSTKTGNPAEASLEDFKRQMQEFIAEINADTAEMEDKNIKQAAPSSGTNQISRPNKRALTEETSNDPKPKRHVPEKKPVRFSNNIKDAVKTVCQVCKTDVPFDKMRGHTKREHDMGISEYKLAFGELEDKLVEAVRHH